MSVLFASFSFHLFVGGTFFLFRIAVHDGYRTQRIRNYSHVIIIKSTRILCGKIKFSYFVVCKLTNISLD